MPIVDKKKKLLATECPEDAFHAADDNKTKRDPQQFITGGLATVCSDLGIKMIINMTAGEVGCATCWL